MARWAGEKLEQEFRKICDDFCNEDPDAVFDDAEWNTYFEKHASAELKAAAQRKTEIVDGEIVIQGYYQMAIRYPEHLEAEFNKILDDYAAQFGPDDDYDEADFRKYYVAHASEELKQNDREMEEYYAKRLPGVHQTERCDKGVLRAGKTGLCAVGFDRLNEGTGLEIKNKE